MNIWILKYSKSGFLPDFINKAVGVSETISQLEHHTIVEKAIGDFHLISIVTKFEKSQKKYIQFSNDLVSGYSGLLIGKDSINIDLRDIKNVFVDNLESYSGQFSLFNIHPDKFECVVDNFGFHKVFYFKIEDDIYVSNSMDLLKQTGLLVPDRTQMVLDLITSRFGVYPGYETLFENVFTLPEYGKIQIDSDGLSVSSRKNINELLQPNRSFEDQLNLVVNEFKNNAAYLRTYHHTVVPLSGGFDGRLILSFFYNTTGKPLETMTYNRAGYLDFLIAGSLSKKFNVPHKKINIPTQLKDFEIAVSEFQNSTNDPFYFTFVKASKKFYKADNCFKVSLGGNGADTDWEFGEKHLKSIDKSNFKSFVKSYSIFITKHTLVDEDFSKQMADKLEKYFLNKYAIFDNHPDFMKLLASAFFHLERFRGRQGFLYTQESNKNHDVFAPFATESFNKLVFLANKNQLQRPLKQGINYRIYSTITEGKVPWAPVLTAKNEFGNNFLQKIVNYIFPYLPKIEWKLRNGDTNTRLRRAFSKKVNVISLNYLKTNEDEKLYQLIDGNKIKRDIDTVEYKGQYNDIATMLKFIENNTRKK